MNKALFPHPSLARSSRTRTRKDSISADTMVVCTPSRTSTLPRRNTRPPPLQIIPELSEKELDIGVSPSQSPMTARPTQSFLQQQDLDTSRTTLSAYTFSIDDALFMFGAKVPCSPALSASSSTSDGASSEGVPTTPSTSDDEDHIMLPTPRLCPKRITIRPLCITKTRSLVCQEDEDIHTYFEKESGRTISLPVAEERPELLTEAKVATEATEEAEQDFYTNEFEDFISLSPVVSSTTYPARRDSLTITAEALPIVIEAPKSKPRGRSRHSKPLPLLPPVTPPITSLPPIPTLALVQTSARKSIVRRKRNVLSLPDHSSPSFPSESRPPPRMAVPLDIEDFIFPEDNSDIDIPSPGPITIQQIYDADEDTSVYYRSSFPYATSTSTCPLPSAIPETPLSGMYGEVTLPHSSTDSDAPRSSIDSTFSSASPTSSNTPVSPFFFPESPSSESHESESTHHLRSRWSSSTLASLPGESPRTLTLLSPLKNVLGSRARRVLLPPQKVPPQTPPHPTSSMFSKNKQGLPTTPSPLSTLGKHIRRHRSRSTSSAGTSSSEGDNHDGLPSGTKRKPIPVSMFLRNT